jgi:GDP-4-dehydro-6-deoxy-D-mannose reductase
MNGCVLVTGCNGFVGRHLTDHLLQSGTTVVGVDLQESSWSERLPYDRIDISDARAVLDFIDSHSVESVFHLAAIANPRSAQENPLEAIRTNILGSTSLFEACRMRLALRLLVIGSSEQYAKHGQQDLFLSEDSPLEAATMYGVTKSCSEAVGRTYAAAYGCHIVFTRSFNHTGPGQSVSYVLSDFARQCAEVSLGLRDPVLHVGNIDVQRDFLDVADVVRAYLLLVGVGVPGTVYNVCSSESHSLRALLSTLISFTGRNDINIVSDPDRIRRDEPRVIRGDSQRLREAARWTPLVPISDTLRRLYGYWLEQIHR